MPLSLFRGCDDLRRDQWRHPSPLLGAGLVPVLADARAAAGMGVGPVDRGLTLLPLGAVLLLSPPTAHWSQVHGPVADGSGSLLPELASSSSCCSARGSSWTVVLPGAVLLGLGLALAVAPAHRRGARLRSCGPGRHRLGRETTPWPALAGLLGVAAVPWPPPSPNGRAADDARLTADFTVRWCCAPASVCSQPWPRCCGCPPAGRERADGLPRSARAAAQLASPARAICSSSCEATTGHAHAPTQSALDWMGRPPWTRSWPGSRPGRAAP
jgi:hypothetical protein